MRRAVVLAAIVLAGIGAALASPLLRVPALTTARALAASPFPGAGDFSYPFLPDNAPSSFGALTAGFGKTCTGDVCLPPSPRGMTASEALLGYEMQNQCSFHPQNTGPMCQPVANMTVSSNYLNGVLPMFEGDVHQYYNDSQCNCTAGVGHLVQHGQCPASLAAPGKKKSPQATHACVKNTGWKSPNAFPGASVSNAQITAWEKTDIAWAVGAAKKVLSGKDVTQTEFDAVVDLTYNGGLNPKLGIRKAITVGNFQAAIKANSQRGKNNHLSQNRVNFENGGLAEGTTCK